MAVTEKNMQRAHAILVSRAFKDLFWIVAPRRSRWRWLFLNDDGELRRAGEAALAELRNYAGVNQSSFRTDPLLMARMEGRREVVMRIINYLNLDEAQVQILMEIDDGR